MSQEYILAIDQGTTSCRALIYNDQFDIISIYQREFTQYFQETNWVEHDALELWNVQLDCCLEAIKLAKIKTENILCIGITNQRETIVAWDNHTGLPLCKAIVWQDQRTQIECEKDKKILEESTLQKVTGLNHSPYFSASKIRWILQNIPQSKLLVSQNRLSVGTIDSWLLWQLTQGKSFKTETSNASRTNLFNISTLKWDEQLFDYYQIPKNILPEVVSSDSLFGMSQATFFGREIPITGILGDQQASLYGQDCFESGMTKNTFGTGCFILQNIGNAPKWSNHKLLTTIAWTIDDMTTYALEGSIFNAGSAVKWLKDQLGLIDHYDQIEAHCQSIANTENVYVVPAFTGLGSPYWDSNARGTILGLSRNSSKSHIIRATMESLAYQSKDILDIMQLETNLKIPQMMIDGGVSNSNFLLQYLSDILQIPIQRSQSVENTALGVAKLAYKSQKKIKGSLPISYSNKTNVTPKMDLETRDIYYKKWLDAVARSRDWSA